MLTRFVRRINIGNIGGRLNVGQSSVFLNSKRLQSSQLLIDDEDTSSAIKESSGTKFQCDENYVIINRKHSGDENGDTWYKYAKLKSADGTYATVSTSGVVTSSWIQESGKDNNGCSEWNASNNYVMVGREHEGDENGDTRYYSQGVYFNGLQCAVFNEESSVSVKESDGEWPDIPANCVLTGRKHCGDENGTTTYYYAKVYSIS